MARFRIIDNPVSEIEAICNGILARLAGLEGKADVDGWHWEIIRGQLMTAVRIAKNAKDNSVQFKRID